MFYITIQLTDVLLKIEMSNYEEQIYLKGFK